MDNGHLTSLNVLIILCGSLILGSGCEKSQPAPQESQYVAGEQLYNSYCASCHEVENGIGPLLKKEVIATRMTAQSLFTYNKRNMPYEAGNTLSEEAYWSITAYMLIREGFVEESYVLTPENAAELSLVSGR